MPKVSLSAPAPPFLVGPGLMESSALFSDASYEIGNVLGENDAKYDLSVISSLDLDCNSSFPCSFLIRYF